MPDRCRIGVLQEVSWSYAPFGVDFYRPVGLAYSPDHGTLVALTQWGSSDTKVFVSEDGGQNWSESTNTPLAIRDVEDIAYGNGVFIAIESSGQYSVSSDGGWTWGAAQTLPSSPTSCKSIVSDGTTFVVVSGYTVHASTNNGASFVEAEYLGSAFLDAVCVGAGVWSAGNSDGEIYTSSVGTSGWSAATSPLSANDAILSAAYGGGLHLLAGYGDTGDGGLVATSPDGSAWTEQQIPGLTTVDAACYDSQSGLFQLVGWTPEDETALVTGDGASWSDPVPGPTYGEGLFDIRGQRLVALDGAIVAGCRYGVSILG